MFGNNRRELPVASTPWKASDMGSSLALSRLKMYKCMGTGTMLLALTLQ